MYRIELSSEEKEKIEKIITDKSVSNKMRRTAEIILLASKNWSHSNISKEVGVHINTVTACIKKYSIRRMNIFTETEPKKGAPYKLTEKSKEWICQTALNNRHYCQPGFNAECANSIKTITSYIRSHCKSAGFPELQHISESSIYNVLRHSQDSICYLQERSRYSSVIPREKHTTNPYYFWDDSTLDYQDLQDLIMKWQLKVKK